MLKKYGQELVYKIIHPFIEFLIRTKVTPNAITSVGLVINFIATIVLIIGAEYGERGDHRYIGVAGGIILFAGLFDMIDGRLARVGHMSSKFGALYDSVLDRYSELIMFFGICYYLISHDYFVSSVFAFVAMIGSIMVSYTRARAEGLGVDCSVGWMQRPERILLISISAIICGIVSYFVGVEKVTLFSILIFEPISIFIGPLMLLAVMSNITALRRLNHSKHELEGQ
ncbi:MAG: CDP-alcohol phosphatidyltransferase family protein [Bacteroidota bacterium]